MKRYFSLHGVSTVAAVWLFLESGGMTSAFAGEMTPDDVQRCTQAAGVCAAGDPFCVTYKNDFAREGLTCPGVNAPAPLIPSRSVSAANRSGNKLQEIHALCSARVDTPLSSEIPCEKTLINASVDPIFNARDPATQLYMIEADKLLQRVVAKHIAEIDGRATHLRILLDLEDRHRPELMAIAANDSAAALTAQQQNAQIAATQERENLRLAAEESARQAEARQIQQQQNQAVAFCVAEANERIAGANFAVRNQITQAQGAYMIKLGFNHQSGPPFVEASCMNDQNWYRNIPQPSRTMNCQNTGGGNATCREQ